MEPTRNENLLKLKLRSQGQQPQTQSEVIDETEVWWDEEPELIQSPLRNERWWQLPIQLKSSQNQQFLQEEFESKWLWVSELINNIVDIALNWTEVTKEGDLVQSDKVRLAAIKLASEMMWLVKWRWVNINANTFNIANFLKNAKPWQSQSLDVLNAWE